MKEAELNKWQTEAFNARLDFKGAKEALAKLKADNASLGERVKDLEKSLSEAKDRLNVEEKLKR
jgi:predicted  nucleic acid-binding Zn-ribbon protein